MPRGGVSRNLHAVRRHRPATTLALTSPARVPAGQGADISEMYLCARRVPRWTSAGAGEFHDVRERRPAPDSSRPGALVRGGQRMPSRPGCQRRCRRVTARVLRLRFGEGPHARKVTLRARWCGRCRGGRRSYKACRSPADSIFRAGQDRAARSPAGISGSRPPGA